MGGATVLAVAGILWVMRYWNEVPSLRNGPIEVHGPVSDKGVEEVVRLMEYSHRAEFQYSVRRMRVWELWNRLIHPRQTFIAGIEASQAGILEVRLIHRRPGHPDSQIIHQVEVRDPTWWTTPGVSFTNRPQPALHPASNKLP